MTCVPNPGELCPLPTIEANIPPIEGSPNGVIVVDASIPYFGIGMRGDNETKLVLQVREGFVSSRTMSGWERAQDVLLNSLRSEDDEKNAWNVAELGLGLNPYGMLTGKTDC